MRPIIAQRPVPSRPAVARSAAAGLAVIVLAAGASRRLGRPKALVRLGGTPLVRRQAALAARLCPGRVVVVAGAHATRVRAAVGPLARLVVNRNWRDGQASSLRAGLRALRPDTRHVLVVAVDQWRLDAAALRVLCRRRGRHPVGVLHDGHVGVPVVFPRSWFARLSALGGDRGARALLAGAPVVALPLARAGADLDTPADLARAQRGSLGRPGPSDPPRRRGLSPRRSN